MSDHNKADKADDDYGTRDVWVVRDRVNGDCVGPHPSYLWVYVTRAEAMAKWDAHRRDTTCAGLGRPVSWPLERLTTRYRRGTGQSPNYWSRKPGQTEREP